MIWGVPRYGNSMICEMAFFYFLVGCTIFTDNSNKHINMIWLNVIRDLGKIHAWSGGGMTLAYLYHYLCKATDFAKTFIGGYMTDD